MSFEDQPTEQLRQTPPPGQMPGPLDPTRTSEPDTTEALPLDELLGPTAAPEASAPEAVAEPAEEPIPEPTAHADPTPTARDQRKPGLAERLRTDAATAIRSSGVHGQEWISHGDNLVIALTVLVALLLLISVAAL